MPELSISEGVERVVMKAMNKERDARYATMEELLADVDAVQAGRAIDAPPPLEPPRRGRARLVAVAVAAAVLLAVGLTVAMWPRRPPPPPSISGRVEPPRPPPVEAPKPAKSTTVVVNVNSEPPGAAVSDGDTLYGKTPCKIKLKSGEAVQLSLTLDGYDPYKVEVRPVADDTVKAILKRLKSRKRTRPTTPTTANQAPTQKPEPRGETLPNPYAKP
jgi:hypothetical protein